MPWTPLHAALGEIENELTFDIVKRAVAEGVEEQANLDWKTNLPLTATETQARQGQGMELAKDIAAMANSGGGVIVYGVKEREGNTSAAGEIKPVGAIGETDLRNIRQVANSLIYPPVTGLDLIRLAPEEDAESGVLVAIVNPSLDVPHLLHQKGNHEWFQAPWRDGPETRRMTERQLADAYRQREQGRQQQDASFEKHYDDFVQTLGAMPGSIGPKWVIGVAQPIQPRMDDRRLSSLGTRRFVDKSRTYFEESWISPLYEVIDANVRTGLRRYILSSSRPVDSKSIKSRVELHGNGSISLALTRDGFLGPNDLQSGQVSTVDIERVTMNLIAMILNATETGSVVSDHRVRIGVAPNTQIFRHPDPVLAGLHQPFDESQRITNHQPLDAVIVTRFGRGPLLDSAAEFLTDLMAQVGRSSFVTGSDLQKDIAVGTY